MLFDDRYLPWMDDANCASTGGEGFFLEDDESKKARGSYREALRVCDACTVQVECLQYALDRNILDGLWGGLVPHERRDLRRRLAPDEGYKRREGLGRWVA